jgi:MFS transporter, Spinster family, sphingosine-1-phosphate transporter
MTILSPGTPSPTAAKTGWFHHRWTTLALFTLLALFCYIDRFVLAALLTPIKGELGLHDEQLGRLNMIFIIAYITIVPLAGIFGDRFPRKWFIFFALVLWSFASIGSGWATALGSLLVWRALVGVGEGIFSSLSPSWIADTFSPRLRSVAFAVFQSTSQIGCMIAYVFGGIAAARWNWHYAFYLAGAPGLVLALVLIFVREPARGESDGHATSAAGPTWSQMGALFGNANYLLYLFGYMFRFIAVSGLSFWGPALLHRQFGITNQAATSFFGSAYLFAGAPGVFVAGILVGHLLRRTQAAYALWIFASDLFAGIALTLALLYASTLNVAEAILLCQMFFAGNSLGIQNPLLFHLVPVALRNTAVSGTMMLATGLSAFFSSELIGLVSDHYGLRNALLLLPIGYFIAAALWATLAAHQRASKEKSPVHEGVLQTA